MLENLKEMLREVLADDELFQLTALIAKKAHVAMIEAGFTPKEATEIISGQGAGFKMGS